MLNIMTRKSVAFVFVMIVVLISPVHINAKAKYYDKYVKNYDNISFSEVEKFFYNQLSDEEQVLYNQIYEKYEKSEDSIVLKSEQDISVKVNKAWEALCADRPEVQTVYRLDSNYLGDDQYYTVEIVKSPYYSEYIRSKAEARKNQMVKTIGSNTTDRYVMMERLRKYLADNTVYDPYYVFNTDKRLYYDSTAYGVFFNQEAICEGYADSIKILCNELKIPCVIVGNIKHAWNLVQMDDGKWYSIDGTYDAYKDCWLLGYECERYDLDNYQGSEFYLYTMGGFVFPLQSKTQYPKVLENSDISYNETEIVFNEPKPRFLYDINEDGESCTITGYEGKQGENLIIPEAIDGYLVTTIGEDAFYHCVGFTGNIEVPDSVKYIKRGAFQACHSIQGELKMSSNILEIEDYAFLGCERITGQICLPNSLRKLGNNVYFNCYGFTGDVVLPSGLESVGSAFSGCKGLDGTLYFPNGLEWNSAILENTSVKKVDILDSNEAYSSIDGIVYSKDGRVLLFCPASREKKVTFEKGLEEIGNLAFYKCTHLKGDLVFPEGLKRIGELSFSESGFDGTITFPSTLEYIGRYAFQDIDIHGNLAFPNALTDLGEGAFFGCDKLRFSSITLSNQLSKIKHNTFNLCYLGGDLVIPSSVRSIEEDAFGDTNFNSITFNEIEEIDENAVSSKRCEEDASVIVICKCQNEYVRKFAAENGFDIRLEHVRGGWIKDVAPTCSEEGYSLYHCTVCKNEYKDDYIEKTAHIWGQEYTIDKAPTNTESGIKSIHCKNCSARKDILEIPAIIDNTPEMAIRIDIDTNPQNAKSDINDEKTESKGICLKKTTISSVENNKKKTISIKWKINKKADGYEIQYALNKGFSKSKKSKIVKSSRKSALNIRKLTKGKTYYIRVRAYKMEGTKKYYGKWSKTKKIKIKK